MYMFCLACTVCMFLYKPYTAYISAEVPVRARFYFPSSFFFPFFLFFLRCSLFLFAIRLVARMRKPRLAETWKEHSPGKQH